MLPVKRSRKTSMSGEVFRLITGLVAHPPQHAEFPCIDILEQPLLQGDAPSLSCEHPLAHTAALEGCRDQSLRSTALGYPGLAQLWLEEPLVLGAGPCLLC